MIWQKKIWGLREVGICWKDGKGKRELRIKGKTETLFGDSQEAAPGIRCKHQCPPLSDAASRLPLAVPCLTPRTHPPQSVLGGPAPPKLSAKEHNWLGLDLRRADSLINSPNETAVGTGWFPRTSLGRRVAAEQAKPAGTRSPGDQASHLTLCITPQIAFHLHYSRGAEKGLTCPLNKYILCSCHMQGKCCVWDTVLSKVDRISASWNFYSTWADRLFFSF